MAIVFQYGSNCLENEINSSKRLNGAAMFVDIAETVEYYTLDFDVYSKNRNCAAADIVRTDQKKKVWGVLYDIPDELLSRVTAPENTKSLDAIEGENSNYRRYWLLVRYPNGRISSALTYVAKRPKKKVKRTSFDYVKLIIDGLRQHYIPESYINEVKEVVKAHSPRLGKKIINL
jgi:gamma-glutamylcyclotransferase (GGCT)/AIG2-like uncharacterized protein YtfP